MFFSFNKKSSLLFCILYLSLLFCNVQNNAKIVPTATQAPIQKYTVVIDAGHGGKDVGTRGIGTDVLESSLNLQYSYALKTAFEQAGFQVVLTRKDENSLCSNPLGFHKRKDMEIRKQIIKTAKPHFIISIHMNEFLGDKNQSGAQVFYQKNDEKSEAFAIRLQDELNKINNKPRLHLAGDFFVLKDALAPAVIVECGFLSNEQEEKRLQTKEHKEVLCNAIVIAVVQSVLSQ
jgi:N-acetylmuramoyl-L-alanine amidase